LTKANNSSLLAGTVSVAAVDPKIGWKSQFEGAFLAAERH
jgi:hypothetical protein